MITQLDLLLAALPERLQSAFNNIFVYETALGQALPPAEMQAWVKQHFGSLEAVQQQHILKITNRLTLEGALFNPLRARRPAGKVGDDAELERWIATELHDDMFARPLTDTTADVFGRIQGRFCVTASNVAKYDAWHGLIIPNEAQPLHFSAEQLEDYMATALRWIATAHAHDSAAVYPIITWNCMPKSGATIVHGHWQMALTRGMHYARVELWRRVAQHYLDETGHSYWQDFTDIHSALGLQLPVDMDTARLHAFAHLTPLRNNEIVIFSDASAFQNDMGSGLAASLHRFLRHLIERQGMRAFNIAIALPALVATPESWEAVPVIARLADRGPALTTRNDWGAMELYGTGVITADPFEVAAAYRNGEY